MDNAASPCSPTQTRLVVDQTPTPGSLRPSFPQRTAALLASMRIEPRVRSERSPSLPRQMKSVVMRRIPLAAIPILLSLSPTAVIAEPQCADASATVSSSDRGARRAQQDRRDPATSGDTCRVYIKQFVEAVAARKDAASCQNGVARQRALGALDAEIEAFNDRIAESSCQP